MTDPDNRKKGTWWARIVGTEAEVSAVRSEAEAIFHEQAEANAKLRAELLMARSELESRSSALALAERQVAELKEQRAHDSDLQQLEHARSNDERERLRRESEEELSRLHVQQRAMRVQLEDAGKRRAQLEGAVATKTAAVDSLTAALEALREEHGRSAKELEVARSDIGQLKALLQQREAELAAREASAGESMTGLEQARTAVARAQAEAATLRSAVADTNRELATSRLAIVERDAEITRLTGLLERLPAVETQLRELSDRSSALELEHRDSEVLLSRRGEEIARVQSALTDSESRQSRLSEEHASLKETMGILRAQRSAETSALEAKLRAAEDQIVEAGAAARILIGLGMGALRECVGPHWALPLQAAWRALAPSLATPPGPGRPVATWLDAQLSAARVGARIAWEGGTYQVRAVEGSGSDPFDVEWVRALALAVVGAR